MRIYQVRKSRRLFRVLSVWIAAASPMAVCAETDLFNMSLDELMEIRIESATKTPHVVKDIAASVTILTRDDIALMGYTTLEELLMNVPGFYHVDNYEDFLIGVRGIIGGSLAFLVNGVQQHPNRIKGLTVPARSRTNIPIESIDRIEIIRGPSSVIYGNNAFLGSINIVTNEAGTQGHTLVAGAGSNGTGKAVVRLATESQQRSLVLNLGYYETDGVGGSYRDMMSAEHFSDLQDAFDAGMNQHQRGERDHQHLNLDFSGREGNLIYGARYSQMEYGFYVGSPGYHNGNRLELTSWYGNLGYSWALSSKLSASVNAVYSEETYDLFEPDFFAPDIEGFQEQGSRRWEVESLLRYEATDRWNWLLGLNLRRYFDIGSEAWFGIGGDTVAQSMRESEAADSQGIFVNTDYHMSQRLKLEAGYRVSRIEPTELVVNDTDRHEVGDRTDQVYRFALVGDLTDSQQLKLIHSSATQDHAAVAFVEPEKIRSSELIYLYTSKNTTFSSGLFHNDTRSLLRRSVRLVSGGFDTVEDNSGEWHTQGFEAIITHRPTPNLTTELSGVVQDTQDHNAWKTKVGNSPQSIAKLKLGYGLSRGTVSLSAAYVGEMKADYTANYMDNIVERQGDTVAPYWLVSANFRFQPPQQSWYLNFHAMNINDAKVRYTASELVNLEQGAFGPSRQVMVTFGVELD